ncbi:MAG: hypothetical protein GKR98_13065 [Boseongicola sp.]|nr:MAG: hypothetical protein GKR98_13065 [Boseongicola sp.]
MTSLTKRAVDMLLQVVETRTAKVQASVLRQVSPRATDQLLEAKLMVASGHIPVVTAMDDYEDEPIPAEWCAERRQYGYNNSIGRWVAVDAKEIAALAVDYPLLFAKMLVDFERAAPARPISLIDSVAWDIGTIQLKGAKSPVPVWFARRLSDPAVWKKVGALLERRPPDGVRVILTSTPGDRLPVAASKKDIVISVTDVAKAAGKLAISPQAVCMRVFPGHAQRRFPIDHSEDFGVVYVHDEVFKFRGLRHRDFLAILFGAYWSGRPVCRTITTLSDAGFSEKTNSLSKAFSGRTDWQSFIKYDEGNCWIEA